MMNMLSYSSFCWPNRLPEIQFPVPAGCENYAVKCEDEEKAAGCVTFTMFVLNRVSFGC